MADESERKPLPFEPSSKRKKQESSSGSSPQVTPAPGKSQGTGPKAATQTPRAKASGAKPKAASQKPLKSRRDRADTQIPEVVSRRMLTRMLTFSGIPTGLGIAVFFISYGLVVRQVVDLPNVAVLLTTLGCFGLGVVGLSYGALSTSWEENRPGSWLGLDEFQVNFGRMINAWRETREARRDSAD